MERNGRGIIFLCVIVTLILLTGSSMADAGGYAQTGVDKFKHTYSLSGDPANDIASIAEAQEGLGMSDLGYTASWCAAFVNDCAKFAGAEDAIPFVSGRTHFAHELRIEIINKGGHDIATSEAKRGDIAFFDWDSDGRYDHVGICTSNTATIEGNIAYGGNKIYLVRRSTISNRGGSVQVVRPNYTNYSANLLHPFVYNDSFYAAVNSDLSSWSVSDRKRHWIEHGIYEGRCASPVFDIMYYKGYQDLKNAFRDDYVAYVDHYVENGYDEGRQASFFFDPNTYRTCHEDLQTAFGNNNEKLIQHFINSGISEYRGCSSPYFSLDVYRDNYADLQDAFGVSPNDAMKYIVHYLTHGGQEGRVANYRLRLYFVANGGTVDTEFKEITFQRTYGELPIPEREGYSFAGWFTEAVGGDQVTENTVHASMGDSIVYAHWTELSPVITVNHSTTIGTDATATVSLPAGAKSLYIEFGRFSDSGDHYLLAEESEMVSTSTYTYTVPGLYMNQAGIYYFRVLTSETEDWLYPDENDANNNWVEKTFTLFATQLPDAPTVETSGTDFIYTPGQTVTITVPGAEAIAISSSVNGFYSGEDVGGSNPTSKAGSSFETELWYIGRFDFHIWAKVNGLWSPYSQVMITCRPPENMLTLPSDLKVIDSQALAGLESVDAVRLPASAETIADDAFNGTNCIVLIPYENAIGESINDYCIEHGLELMYE